MKSGRPKPMVKTNVTASKTPKAAAPGYKSGGCVKMAAGGAAKQRKDFPNTIKPKK